MSSASREAKWVMCSRICGGHSGFTAPGDLALQLDQLLTTGRTLLRHSERLGTIRTVGIDHVDHLGDDVAGLLNGDCITGSNILASYFILIVEGGTSDGGTRQKHRFQLGYRSDASKATHLKRDRLHQGRGLFSLKLVGDSPSGSP